MYLLQDFSQGSSRENSTAIECTLYYSIQKSLEKTYVFVAVFCPNFLKSLS